MKFSTISKLIIAILVVAAGVLFVRRYQAAHAIVPFGVGQVTRMDLEQRVTISGQVQPKRRLDVKPPFAGYVEKIFVKVGDRVKEKDPLITFSQTLVGDEKNYPVRATFPGVVTQILRLEGESVTDQGDTTLVLRVEDLSSLSVLASVPELDIAKIKRGQAAMVKVAALSADTFDGDISEIAMGAREKDRYGTSSTAEFQIRVALKSHDPRILPGMSALMDVITASRPNVLTLPHEFIQEQGGKYFVTTIDGVKKPVTLGMQTEEAAEIKTGVVDGEKVRVIDFLNLPHIEE